METSQYLRVLRRWWWLLFATAVVGAVVAYAASRLITPTYEASTTLLVVQQQTPGVVERNDLETSVLLANTFRGMITVRPLLERAIERGGFPLSADDLRARLSIDNPRESQLLIVSARASDPALARDIANVVAEVFVTSDELALTSSAGRVSVIEPATTPGAPVSPRRGLNALLGGAMAFLAATLMVLLFEYLDDTVKSGRRVQELAGVPTLGQVAPFGRTPRPANALRAAVNPASPAAEHYRTLRTNLANTLARYAEDGGPLRAVLFSGIADGDGTTTTLANLGVMYGLAGYRVVLVDGNLRKPGLHRIFGFANDEGLSTLLASDGTRLAKTVLPTPQPNVEVLVAGPVPTNPSELLGSGRMRRLLDQLGEAHDLILVDSPPVLSVTDASVLAGIVDASVLVLRPGRTRASELRGAVEQLASSGRPVAGVVLNRASRGQGDALFGTLSEPLRSIAGRVEPRPTANGRASVEEEAVPRVRQRP